MTFKVLIVDDEPTICEFLSDYLESLGGFEVISFSKGEPAFEHIYQHGADIVFLDHVLPGGKSGLELLESNKDLASSTIFIVLTGYADLDKAQKAIRNSAVDFIEKPPQLDTLKNALDRALGTPVLKRKVALERYEKTPVIDKIIGESQAITDVKDKIRKFAKQDFLSVLISGESGTGKTVVAQAIHESSPRAKGPIVLFSCRTTSENMVEPELLGFSNSVYLDSPDAKIGSFAKANNGTLIIKEVGELSKKVQTLLLGFIDEKRFTPIGACSSSVSDARVVCTTSEDIPSMALHKKMRRDLVFRLFEITINVPPLRSRGRDVILLARHFLEQHACLHSLPIPTLQRSAENLLSKYSWPGNVRELENLCLSIVMEFPGKKIKDADMLALSSLKSFHPTEQTYEAARNQLLDNFTVHYLNRLLLITSGNISETARIAGIERSYLYKLIKKYRISIKGDLDT